MTTKTLQYRWMFPSMWIAAALTAGICMILHKIDPALQWASGLPIVGGTVFGILLSVIYGRRMIAGDTLSSLQAIDPALKKLAHADSAVNPVCEIKLKKIENSIPVPPFDFRFSPPPFEAMPSLVFVKQLPQHVIFEVIVNSWDTLIQRNASSAAGVKFELQSRDWTTQESEVA